MRKMKKALALVLASVMTLALAAPTWADTSEVEKATVSVNEDSNAVFKGYQLMNMSSELKGDCGHTENASLHTSKCYNVYYEVNEKYKDVMLNAAKNTTSAKWTEDKKGEVTENNLIDYLSSMSEGEAQKFGDVVYEKISDDIDEDVIGIDKGGEEIDQGWWLFVDTRTNDQLKEEEETRSVVLLKTHGQTNITISPKSDSPELEKEIVEKSDSGEEETSDHTSAGIGDTVTFRLTAENLPSPVRLESYKIYKCEFHDTLSKGLEYVDSTVDVYVETNGNRVTTLNENTDYTVSAETSDDDTSETKVEIKISDLKKVEGWQSGSILVAEYQAKVTKDAEIGNPGNKNKAYLNYTNDPYNSGEGDPAGGQTPDDVVAVFSFEVDGSKVDSYNENVKLPGATFVLYKLENGTEKYAEFAENSDDKKVIANWSELGSGENKENKQFNEKRTLVSGKDGKFEITGLEEGTYYLVEIAAPAGYNMLKGELKLEVVATYTTPESDKDAPKVDSLKVTVTDTSDNSSSTEDGNVNSGIANITVKNSTGTQLPETGGMGTTVIYLAGGLLAAGAILLLIFRRRRNG